MANKTYRRGRNQRRGRGRTHRRARGRSQRGGVWHLLPGMDPND